MAKYRTYYERTGIQTHKTICCKLKDPLIEKWLWSWCRSYNYNAFKNTITEYNWIAHNPQDVVRDALYEAGIDVTNSLKMMQMDKSSWQPGESVRTSFYKEDAELIRNEAKERGVSAQYLIEESLREYFQLHGHVPERLKEMQRKQKEANNEKR